MKLILLTYIFFRTGILLAEEKLGIIWVTYGEYRTEAGKELLQSSLRRMEAMAVPKDQIIIITPIKSVVADYQGKYYVHFLGDRSEKFDISKLPPKVGVSLLIGSPHSIFGAYESIFSSSKTYGDLRSRLSNKKVSVVMDLHGHGERDGTFEIAPFREAAPYKSLFSLLTTEMKSKGITVEEIQSNVTACYGNSCRAQLAEFQRESNLAKLTVLSAAPTDGLGIRDNTARAHRVTLTALDTIDPKTLARYNYGDIYSALYGLVANAVFSTSKERKVTNPNANETEGYVHSFPYTIRTATLPKELFEAILSKISDPLVRNHFEKLEPVPTPSNFESKPTNWLSRLSDNCAKAFKRLWEKK